MTTLADLIERLEKATGPDRGLDQAIALSLGWKLWRSKHGYWNFDDPDGNHVCDNYGSQLSKYDPDTGNKNPDYDLPPLFADRAQLPEWTSSIDAALTLVPEGWWSESLGQFPPDHWCAGKWNAQLFRDVHPDGNGEIADSDTTYAVSSNGAIALCIAALKARSAT